MGFLETFDIFLSKMLVFWKYIFVFSMSFVLRIVILNTFIGFGVIFCIYEHILKMILHFLKNVQKCEDFSYDFFVSENVYILVFSAGNITGIFGGKYYW